MTITVTEKRCLTCGETKSVDGFSRNRSRPDGLGSQCKDCLRDYKRAYYAAHREEIRAYREAHREELRAKSLAYREAHREELRARARNWSALVGNPTAERNQEITAKHATHRGEPWSEAEEAYLATSTDRIVDDALALKRTYKSVERRLTLLRRRGVSLARDRALAA